MNLMLLTIFCTKAAYCCHKNKSFADLKEDNEYLMQLPLTAPNKLDIKMSEYSSVEDIKCQIGVTIWPELWSYDTIMTGNIYIENGLGRVC